MIGQSPLTPIQTKSVFILNLGCAKNLVDANVISQIRNSAGYKHARSMREANFVIINTCGFIHDARVESQEVIADALKNRRKGQFVIASGCLSQRLNAELYEQFPSLDGLVGTRNLQDVLLLLDDLSKSAIPKRNKLPAYTKLKVDANLSNTAVQGGSSYLKIADGATAPALFVPYPSSKVPW